METKEMLVAFAACAALCTAATPVAKLPKKAGK